MRMSCARLTSVLGLAMTALNIVNVCRIDLCLPQTSPAPMLLLEVWVAWSRY